MSDLTPEVLDELDRRATDAISMMGRASIVGSLQFMEAVEPHISALIEAARERDRLDQLLKTEIEDNCEYDTEIRAMCNHVDDQYREPLPDVVQKVVEERDRLQGELQVTKLLLDAAKEAWPKDVVYAIRQYPWPDIQKLQTSLEGCVTVLESEGLGNCNQAIQARELLSNGVRS